MRTTERGDSWRTWHGRGKGHGAQQLACCHVTSISSAAMRAGTSVSGTRICSHESRSRIVTCPSDACVKSTVTTKGTPVRLLHDCTLGQSLDIEPLNVEALLQDAGMPQFMVSVGAATAHRSGNRVGKADKQSKSHVARCLRDYSPISSMRAYRRPIAAPVTPIHSICHTIVP